MFDPHRVPDGKVMLAYEQPAAVLTPPLTVAPALMVGEQRFFADRFVVVTDQRLILAAGAYPIFAVRYVGIEPGTSDRSGALLSIATGVVVALVFFFSYPAIAEDPPWSIAAGLAIAAAFIILGVYLWWRERPRFGLSITTTCGDPAHNVVLWSERLDYLQAVADAIVIAGGRTPSAPLTPGSPSPASRARP